MSKLSQESFGLQWIMGLLSIPDDQITAYIPNTEMGTMKWGHIWKEEYHGTNTDVVCVQQKFILIPF